ncbi:hypothetical protein AAG906_026220 [Vitis piasezkii]
MEYILAVLDWQIYNATCNASTSNLNTSTSFVRTDFMIYENGTVCFNWNENYSCCHPSHPSMELPGTFPSSFFSPFPLLSQLSSTEGNVDKTTLSTSKELEKDIDRYNANRVIGQGGQGTIYKEISFELLIGRKPILSTRLEEWKRLASYFMLSMKEDSLFDLLDARVVKEGRKEEINEIVFPARRCMNLSGKKRPTMMEIAIELERIRKCQGDFKAQENFEEFEYDTIELIGPWDVTSASTRSFLNTNASYSSDV